MQFSSSSSLLSFLFFVVLYYVAQVALRVLVPLPLSHKW